jgi:hypothetical protein
MPKKSFSPNWARFAPWNQADGAPNLRARVSAWVRAGRLPKDLIPLEETLDESAGDVFSEAGWGDREVEGYVRLVSCLGGSWAPASSGPLPLKVHPDKAEGERSDANVESYLRELEKKGADRSSLFRMVSGATRKQPMNLYTAVSLVKLGTFDHGRWGPHRGHLRKLWRQYRMALPLLQDKALGRETRVALHKDLEDIFRCIRYLAFMALTRTDAELGITVDPCKDLSRQRFWTKPTVALVDYLRAILGSHEKAYAATARLFYLLFDYPDKPELVKRRYLHARRK